MNGAKVEGSFVAASHTCGKTACSSGVQEEMSGDGTCAAYQLNAAVRCVAAEGCQTGIQLAGVDLRSRGLGLDEVVPPAP